MDKKGTFGVGLTLIATGATAASVGKYLAGGLLALAGAVISLPFLWARMGGVLWPRGPRRPRR